LGLVCLAKRLREPGAILCQLGIPLCINRPCLRVVALPESLRRDAPLFRDVLLLLYFFDPCPARANTVGDEDATRRIATLGRAGQGNRRRNDQGKE